MDILAPDSANFNHLLQVDINIKPHIKNMEIILSNSIELLIYDSFNKAIEIHSQLPHLNFPISKWLKYQRVHPESILKIFSNIPGDNYQALIKDSVNVIPLKWSIENFDKIYSPFIIHVLLSDPAKDIVLSKGLDYSKFQKDLLSAFVDKIPNYTRETALFAFSELTKFQAFILPENQVVFEKLSSDNLDNFLSEVFKNPYVRHLEEYNQKFFTLLCSDFYTYLKTPAKNPVFEYLLMKISTLQPSDNRLREHLFPTFSATEIIAFQTSKKEHDFLVLDTKFEPKQKKKQLKI